MTFATEAQRNMSRIADKTEKPGKKKKKDVFQIGEHVWVKMKDGTEQESVVHGHHSKNKYYVRKWHANRQGLVHRKFMRHMSKSEIEAKRAPIQC